MMGQTVEQRRGHLGVAEDAGPFAEGEVGGDGDRRALLESADQLEQQLAAELGEGQIAKLVENDKVEPGQVVGHIHSPVHGHDLIFVSTKPAAAQGAKMICARMSTGMQN